MQLLGQPPELRRHLRGRQQRQHHRHRQPDRQPRRQRHPGDGRCRHRLPLRQLTGTSGFVTTPAIADTRQRHRRPDRHRELRPRPGERRLRQRPRADADRHPDQPLLLGNCLRVSGSGPWSWTCVGQYGGSDATCSASIQTYTVTFAAGSNGSITGTAQPDRQPRRQRHCGDGHRRCQPSLRQLDRHRRFHHHQQPADRQQYQRRHDHHRQLCSRPGQRAPAAATMSRP